MKSGFPRLAFGDFADVCKVALAGAIALGAGGARPCLAGDAALLPDQVQTGNSAPPMGDRLAAAESSQGQLAGDGNQVLEIALPERFRGCWQGVAVLDSQRQMSDRWPAVAWSPKTFRLCFVEHGLGVWQFAYGESHEDAEHSNGVEREESVEFVRIEGSTATLQATLVLGSKPTGKYTTIENTTLRCELADGPGASMRVGGDVVAEVDGEPWRAATWHADFARVSPDVAR
jgi:hypothetical protein